MVQPACSNNVAKPVESKDSYLLYAPAMTNWTGSVTKQAEAKNNYLVFDPKAKAKLAKPVELEKPVAPKDSLLFGKTVMVNPGHNCPMYDKKTHKYLGIDPGAQRVLDGDTISEKDLNIQLATYVKQDIEQHGGKVIYVDKLTVNEIRALENHKKPDLFLAIHHNAGDVGDVTSRGETVLANENRSRISMKAADAVKRRFATNLIIPLYAPKDPKVAKALRERGSHLAVLKAKDPKIPAILTETGFISNENELKIIMTPECQKNTAKNIVDGIIDFFHLKDKKRKK